MIRRPPRSTLFPYPTLSRSGHSRLEHGVVSQRKVRLLVPFPAFAVRGPVDRKSTRLNSSHLVISYAVFCLKKKKTYPKNRGRDAIYKTCNRVSGGGITCCPL